MFVVDHTHTSKILILKKGEINSLIRTGHKNKSWLSEVIFLLSNQTSTVQGKSLFALVPLEGNPQPLKNINNINTTKLGLCL